MRKISTDLDQYKKKYNECEFDLKEAKYELNQLSARYTKLQADKEHEIEVLKSQLSDSQLQIETKNKNNDQKLVMISLENERMRKLLETLSTNSNTTSDNNNNASSRTRQHILLKSIQCVDKIKQYTNSNAIQFDQFDYKTYQAIQRTNQVSQALLCLFTAFSNDWLWVYYSL